MSLQGISGKTIPFDGQVGGHAGVMTVEDGSMIIKDSLPKERAFYALLGTHEALAPLRDYVPEYMGQIKLTGVTEGVEVGHEVLQEIASGKESIVLRNVAYEFKKPNILDIKLGTVLYDESANEEKQARMIETARKTTSLESGVRLTGFKVWDPSKNDYEQTPKSYGKSIKVSQLPEGMAKFFPAASIQDRGLLNAVIDGIIGEVQEIKEIFEKVEMRMVGGSLLIVWEGDEEALKASLSATEELPEGGLTGKHKAEAAAAAPAAAERALNEVEVELPGGKGAAEEESAETSSSLSTSSSKKLSLGYAVKMIDFAHTRLAPGEGPDKGVLLGMETTLKLLEGRKAELAVVAEDAGAA
ncbi:hypothetical protein M407DRAFT_244581 [Tulasnella calospora MUT 4182]|uniref:Kinase n=1 Tax=Tulasnella calospora MUT 4182 TaxID=1051891 RepID=A0A0C3LRP4_9AGAM|nr:hypothetical protein M407DRAFT_244581 [Tulasnella calospora MUT 4182]